MRLGREAADVAWTLGRRRDRRNSVHFADGVSLAEIYAGLMSAFLCICLEPCLDLGALFQWSLAPKSH